MVAPFPTPVNMTNYTAVFQYANTVTDSWFGPFVMIALAIVVFLSLLKYDVKRALMVSFLITFVFGAILRALSLVTDWWVYVCGLGFAVVGLWLWWSPD